MIRYRLSVNICQSNKNILLKIKRFLNFGNIVKNKSQWKENVIIYYLQFTHARARWFLNKILPYCQTQHKLKQLKKALRLDKKFVKPRKGV